MILFWVPALLAAASIAPGAPEPAQEPAASAERAPDAELFDDATAHLRKGSYERAAGELFELSTRLAATDERRPWAELQLARALGQLGFHHAAAVHLVSVVRERANPEVVVPALEELKAGIEKPHDEALVDDLFASLDLAFLPDSLSAFVRYQQGMAQLRRGNARWADSYFAGLSPHTDGAARAQFARWMSPLRSAKGVPAGLDDELSALAQDAQLSRPLRNELMLTVARLEYDEKHFDRALAAYRAVELAPLEPGRAALYLEEAWTRYRLGQLYDAMGILTTLDAPSFRDEFLPDKYLLRAFIYRDLCQYEAAQGATRQVARRFASTLEAIHERHPLGLDPPLLRAAIASGPAADAARFYRAVRAERAAAEEGNGPLFDHLRALYERTAEHADRRYRARAQEALEKKASQLLAAAEEARLMSYEISVKVYQRSRGAGRPATEPAAEAAPQPEARTVSFQFQGEYWNDELRDYRFQMQSRCADEVAR